jgi:tetratricopeptide (TPR) repeat protein
MSVLLDALKKAAAEKKKAMEGAVDSERVPSDSNKVPETIVPPALKLATEEVEPTISIDEPTSSAVEDDVKAETALKFTLSDMPTPEPNQDDLNSGISDPSLLLESPDFVSDNIHHSTEESGLLLKQDQPDTVDSSVAQDELDQDLFQVTPSVLSDSESLDSEDSSLPETDKDSFEWSMNALPGYSGASVDDSAPIEKNSILLTGALTSEPKAKKNINTSWLLVLIVVLMFVGISIYGLIYYQKKSEQLENSMRKYELAKVQTSLPKKKLPAATAVDSSLQKAKESTSKLDPTPLVTTTDANHISEVPSTKITSDNGVLPVAQNELATSVMNVPNKTIHKPKITHSSSKNRAENPITKPTYKPVLVKVNKTKIPLSEAYSAYELGHLELSRQKFHEVLSLDPKNITAMIGLGGIAASNGQYYVAMDFYQKALNIEPNSLETYEAIANLSPIIELNSDWPDSLKNMVTIYPSSAALQFALGNLYSSSHDWLAAQESYFNAYALDMNNPDFTVNLAISLDRLGKYPLAAQYYTQALALAGSNKVNFNVSDIKNRLISIRQFMDQEK